MLDLAPFGSAALDRVLAMSDGAGALPLSFLIGLVVGLSLAAPPGPINAIIAHRSVSLGWRQAVRVGMAAPIVDSLYLVLFVFGLSRLIDLDKILLPGSLLGAALLTWFAIQAAKSEGGPPPPGQTFWGVFVLSAANPYQLGWWATGGTILLSQQGPAGVAGFLAGIFAWVVVFAWLMAHGAQKWPSFAPATRLASADLLFAMAVVFVVRVL